MHDLTTHAALVLQCINPVLRPVVLVWVRELTPRQAITLASEMAYLAKRDGDADGYFRWLKAVQGLTHLQ